jgi:hypothetical protein
LDQHASSPQFPAQGLAVQRVALASLRVDPANARLHGERNHPGQGVQRRRARVTVHCPDCDQPRSVRRDSFLDQPPRCRSCSSKRNHRPRARTGSTAACLHCHSPFYRHPSEMTKRYCSPRCGNAARRRYERSERACGECGRKFEYTPRPFSNSAGKYCSLACKRKAFLGGIHGKADQIAATERPGWRSIRNRFVRNGNDFCAVCGTDSGRLHVHHIEGHRNVAVDDLSTVVTLCPKHHLSLEKFTTKIAALPPLRRRHSALVLLGLLGDGLAARRDARLTLEASA